MRPNFILKQPFPDRIHGMDRDPATTGEPAPHEEVDCPAPV